jgi:hypothetical protein
LLAVCAFLGGQHAVGVTAALATVVLLVLAAEGTATAMKLALDELERLQPQGTDEERGAELNGDDPLAGARGASSGYPWPLQAPPGDSARAVVRQATASTKTKERRR